MKITIQNRYVNCDSGAQDFADIHAKPDLIVLLNVKDNTTINVCESKTNAFARPEVRLTMRELWTLLETYQATRQEVSSEGV
jgi:hypothetical protein